MIFTLAQNPALITHKPAFESVKCWRGQDVSGLANSPDRASDGDIAMTLQAPLPSIDKLDPDEDGAPASSSQPSPSPGPHFGSPKQPEAPSLTPEPFTAAAAIAATASSEGIQKLAASDSVSPSPLPNDGLCDKAGYDNRGDTAEPDDAQGDKAGEPAAGQPA